jgi:hypothetical protein
MKANLLLLLVVAITADVSSYIKHAGLNCWDGHGGINIENSSAALR